MKQLQILLLSVFLFSCQTKEQKEIESYKLKNIQLEYLRDLTSLKDKIVLEKEIILLDSLIQKQKEGLNYDIFQ